MANGVLLFEGVPLKIIDLGDGTFALASQAGSGAQVDVSDRAARDCGKIDVAGIDAVGGVAGQKTKAGSIPVTLASDEDMLARAGALDETAPANDTASSGLNGRLQRIAQRLTSLIALLPAALGANGGLKIEGVAGGVAVPSSDAGPGWTSSIGIAGARFTSADQSGSAAAVHTAPGTGLKAVITDIIVSVGTAMTVTFTEETAGTVLFTLYMAANSTIQITPRGKLKLSTAVKRLMVQTSGAGNIAVTTFYYTEA